LARVARAIYNGPPGGGRSAGARWAAGTCCAFLRVGGVAGAAR
jgi:hypothetical protein